MNKKAKILKNVCDKSPFCPVKKVCPVGAVSQKTSVFSADTPVIDKEKCIGCGKCIEVCPRKAVKMV